MVMLYFVKKFYSSHLSKDLLAQKEMKEIKVSVEEKVKRVNVDCLVLKGPKVI